MRKKVVIFGAGNIGAEAAAQTAREGYEVGALVTRKWIKVGNDTVYAFTSTPSMPELLAQVDCVCRRPNLVMTAIPSAGSGADELAITLPYLESAIPVVTSGKAALSQHFAMLQPHLPIMGVNASVGGAVKVNHNLLERLRLDDGHDSIVQLIINGTVMYALNERHGGRSKAAIARGATKLGYAEPREGGGFPTWYEMFMGEIPDLMKKSVIVLNVSYYRRTRRVFTLDDVRSVSLSPEELDRFTGTSVRYVYVVTIATKRIEPEISEDSPGSIWLSGNGVFLYGGFHPFPDNSPLSSWVPKRGPGNGMHIDQEGSEFRCADDGAGDLATVGTMMFDARRLCPPK